MLSGLTLDGKRVSFAAQDVRHIFDIDGRRIWSIYPEGSAYACFFVYQIQSERKTNSLRCVVNVRELQ